MAGNTALAARAALFGTVFLTIVACSGTAAPSGPSAPPSASAPTTSTPDRSPVSPTPGPEAVGANELGLVPVLMYHQIVPDPVSEYDQTPREFRAELARLYREDYRPVTAADYIAGRIDIPAGTHPVVLTFDDSTAGQLSFTKDGEVKPDSAIGILTAFGERHPDFAPTATFYVNGGAFGGGRAEKRALSWLDEHGYEIGAHTATHANLAGLGSAGVQRELVRNLRGIDDATPGHRVRTMALPLGIYPAQRALARKGGWDGTSYEFDAVFLVGAEPAPSPYAQVDPGGVPRIRSGKGEVDFDSGYWLDRLADNAGRRYTSDGDADSISFPRKFSGKLRQSWSDRANPY